MADEFDITLQGLKDFVAKRVQTVWENEQQGILLSRLGMELAQEGLNIRNVLAGRKLAVFLKEEMPSEVQVIASPTNKIVYIALPAEVPADGDLGRFFPQSSKGAEIKELSQLRYAVVAAFSKPLSEGASRIFKVGQTVEYEDIADATELPPGARIIQRNQIEDPRSADDPIYAKKRLLERIIAWAKENGVPMARILYAAAPAAEGTAEETLLHQVLTALSAQQLQRIELPLDVVDTLLRHR